MSTDPQLKDRLVRAAETLRIEPEVALERFLAGRRRREVRKRLATVAAALVVASGGLAMAWVALRIGSEPERPAGPTGPSGTIAYMLVTRDGEAATPARTTVETPTPVILDAGPFAVYPVWSPDGSKVAYGSGRDYDHTELTVANADGSDPRGLGVQVRGAFSWSPDGTWIAYIRGDESRNGFDAVAIIGADGSGDHVVLRGVTWQTVSWSPGGERLLVTGHPASEEGIGGAKDFDIYSLRTDGTELVQLTHTLEFEHFASWSPDGSRILFARSPEYDDADYPSDVWVMNADGSGERRLTDWPGFDSFPVWSPDGSWIAFASDRDATEEQQAAFRKGEAFSGISLYIMRSDGSRAERLLATGEDDTLLPSSWTAVA